MIKKSDFIFYFICDVLFTAGKLRPKISEIPRNKVTIRVLIAKLFAIWASFKHYIIHSPISKIYTYILAWWSKVYFFQLWHKFFAWKRVDTKWHPIYDSRKIGWCRETDKRNFSFLTYWCDFGKLRRKMIFNLRVLRDFM